LTEDGRLLIELQKLWPGAGGVTHLEFTPLEFLRRLTALNPPPFANLIRYHGLLGPRAKLRDLLPAAPLSDPGLRLEARIRTAGAALRSKTAKASVANSAAKDASSPSASSPSASSAHTVKTGLSCSIGKPLAPAELKHKNATDPKEGQAQSESRPLLSTGQRAKRQVVPWAELLRRVFAIDILVCTTGGPGGFTPLGGGGLVFALLPDKNAAVK
jgi:hypothetical protein